MAGELEKEVAPTEQSSSTPDSGPSSALDEANGRPPGSGSDEQEKRIESQDGSGSDQSRAHEQVHDQMRKGLPDELKTPQPQYRQFGDSDVNSKQGEKAEGEGRFKAGAQADGSERKLGRDSESVGSAGGGDSQGADQDGKKIKHGFPRTQTEIGPDGKTSLAKPSDADQLPGDTKDPHGPLKGEGVPGDTTTQTQQAPSGVHRDGGAEQLGESARDAIRSGADQAALDRALGGPGGSGEGRDEALSDAGAKMGGKAFGDGKRDGSQMSGSASASSEGESSPDSKKKDGLGAKNNEQEKAQQRDLSKVGPASPMQGIEGIQNPGELKPIHPGAGSDGTQAEPKADTQKQKSPTQTMQDFIREKLNNHGQPDEVKIKSF